MSRIFRQVFLIASGVCTQLMLRFLLVGQHWYVHALESIRECYLWICTYFTSTAQHSLFLLFRCFVMLYCILRVYKYTQEHNQLIMTTSITNEYTSLQKYKSLTLYFRKGDVCSVWEMSGDKDRLLYWPKFFSLGTSFASWLGLLTKGPKPSVCCWFSLWHPVSNWIEPPGHLVLLFSTSTCFRCSSAYLHWCISWLTARLGVNIQQ